MVRGKELTPETHAQIMILHKEKMPIRVHCLEGKGGSFNCCGYCKKNDRADQFQITISMWEADIHIQTYIHIHLYVCMRVYYVCMYTYM